MKKLLICFFSIILILSSAIISYADSLSCSVGIVCNSTKISKNTKKIEIQVNLDSYNGDGTLGYEGKIEYDSNVFESVTIKQAENWEAVSYEVQTGKFVSTTTNAKVGNVATIVLKVKEGVTANTTDVVITNLTFSDGESTIMLNKTITFSIEQNTEDNGGNNSGNNDNNKDEIDNNKNYDIVSSKNAVIRVIEAESGEKVRDINTYVKKGETIISAYINTPSEEKILSTARGKVIGEVWYIIDINYPYYHHEVKYTGNKKKVLVFNFINKRISLFDFKKYKTFDKNIKSIFDNNVTPISLNYEYQYETEVIDDIYTKEEAKNKAVETAKEKLLLKYSNIKEVKDVTIVNEISNDEQLNLTLFVKAYEDITEYREVIINEEDTTS